MGIAYVQASGPMAMHVWKQMRERLPWNVIGRRRDRWTYHWIRYEGSDVDSDVWWPVVECVDGTVVSGWHSYSTSSVRLLVGWIGFDKLMEGRAL